MIIKGLLDEDFVNYKKPSMFIIAPSCDFKCDKECGKAICQNSNIIKEKNINVSNKYIIDRYIINPISEAIIIGGLEPFDTWEELYQFITDFRKVSNDDIVIYTGYNENEILDKVALLKKYTSIIIKYGRYIPDKKKVYSEILGVELASDNQYAVRIDNENKD